MQYELRALQPEQDSAVILPWRNSIDWRFLVSARRSKISQQEMFTELDQAKKCLWPDAQILYIGTEAVGILFSYLYARKDNNLTVAMYVKRSARGSRQIPFAFVDFCEKQFQQLCLHKIYCDAYAHNVPVRKMILRLGFCEEGVLREHRKIGSRYLDLHKYSILASERGTALYDKILHRALK